MARFTTRDVLDARDICSNPELLEGRLFTRIPCPWCEGPLSLDLEATRTNPTGTSRTARVVACTECEFIRELPPTISTLER